MCKLADRVLCLLCAHADGVGLLVQKGQAVDDPLLFLAPFDAKLWVALLGGVFAVALFQKLISLYTPFGDLCARFFPPCRALGKPTPDCRLPNPSHCTQSWSLVCMPCIAFHSASVLAGQLCPAHALERPF